MIMALETSCDETALALFDPAAGWRGEWVSSQLAVHEAYGGVVPELAAREHLAAIEPLLGRAREVLGGWQDLSEVAVTQGPGLAGCLALGLASAKAVALALGVPLRGVNHLRGHVWSPFIGMQGEWRGDFGGRLARYLPHLALVVSGGNTLLAEIAEDRRLRVLAETRDDAAGEALDKGAKLLGLGYPGGPKVEVEARSGDPAAFAFPRGRGPKVDLDFSFSGLKTALRYQLEKMRPEEILARRADLCASYQQAVVEALVRRLRSAAERGGYRSVGLSGGVANNALLRSEVAEVARRRRVPCWAAEPRHTGDNAAMIAFAAWVDPESRAARIGEGAEGWEIQPSWGLEDATQRE